MIPILLYLAASAVASLLAILFFACGAQADVDTRNNAAGDLGEGAGGEGKNFIHFGSDK